jgi:steroid delta-isomerase-like uncharacterized protein
MTTETVVGKLYDAYNRHDSIAAAKLYAPDGTHADIAHDRPKNGPDEIAAGLRKFFEWFPDARWEPQVSIVGADGTEAVTYLLTATLRKPMGPVASRGQKISLRGVHVLNLRDGLIQRSEDYWDAATFQRQLNNG